jgi:hypothetical protein
LKDEIGTAMTLHRPCNVDTASALALLQEEELLSGKHKSPALLDSHDLYRSSSRVGSSADNGKSKPEHKLLEAPMRADKLDFLVAYHK